jgi:hypothetical protein
MHSRFQSDTNLKIGLSLFQTVATFSSPTAHPPRVKMAGAISDLQHLSWGGGRCPEPGKPNVWFSWWWQQNPLLWKERDLQNLGRRTDTAMFLRETPVTQALVAGVWWSSLLSLGCDLCTHCHHWVLSKPAGLRLRHPWCESWSKEQDGKIQRSPDVWGAQQLFYCFCFFCKFWDIFL